MKSFTLYLTKYKKTGFKSSAREDATFHSSYISHSQIGGKLENKQTPEKVHSACSTSDRCTHVGPLNETTTHLSAFPNKDTPRSWEDDGTRERSCDATDAVDKKETAFLFV